MVQEKLNTEELLASVHRVTAEFLQMVSSFDEQKLNMIPFEGSWTAAQVAEHITLANEDLKKQLLKEGKDCEREPDAGAAQLRSVFLNFDKKLKSPQFIVPRDSRYDRESLITELQNSTDGLMAAAKQQDPFQIISHPIFGEVTRIEMMHFLIYHTQRHIHQLKNIRAAI